MNLFDIDPPIAAVIAAFVVWLLQGTVTSGPTRALVFLAIFSGLVLVSRLVVRRKLW